MAAIRLGQSFPGLQEFGPGRISIVSDRLARCYWLQPDSRRNCNSRAQRIGETSSLRTQARHGALSGQLPPSVTGGHFRRKPAARLLQFRQSRTGGHQRLRGPDPQTVAGYAPGYAGFPGPASNDGANRLCSQGNRTDDSSLAHAPKKRAVATAFPDASRCAT